MFIYIVFPMYTSSGHYQAVRRERSAGSVDTVPAAIRPLVTAMAAADLCDRGPRC